MNKVKDVANMTRKKIFIIILSAVSLLIISAAFFIGFRIDSTSAAKIRLNREITSKETHIPEREKTPEEINYKIINK